MYPSEPVVNRRTTGGRGIMRLPIPPDHALHRWFSGLVQQAMYADVGLCDPTLVDYLADMLTQFIHADRIFPFRDAQGRPIEDVAELLEHVLHQPSPAPQVRDRVIYRHIGDFTLFWTSIYPENLRRLRAQHRKDHLLDYTQQGKRSYAIASELSDADAEPPASLLKLLSDEFETCMYGLGIVREQVRTAAAENVPPKPIWK